MKKKMRIGLTGGMGSGKSLVLRFLSEKGVPVLQADLIGHQVLKRKTIKQKIVKCFGNDTLDSKGRIDRRVLALKVFQNPREQIKINKILHPAIRKEIDLWARKRLEGRYSIVVVEVPLLFERGYYRRFDGVLCVSAPAVIRRERLRARGWSLAEIKRREKLQWPQMKKNKKSDWVIYNQSSTKDLKCSVGRWLDMIRLNRESQK